MCQLCRQDDAIIDFQLRNLLLLLLMFAFPVFLFPAETHGRNDPILIAYAGVIPSLAIVIPAIHFERWGRVVRLFVAYSFPLVVIVYAFTRTDFTRHCMTAGGLAVLSVLETFFPGWWEWWVDSEGKLYLAHELRRELHWMLKLDIILREIRQREGRIAENEETIHRTEEMIRQNNLRIDANHRAGGTTDDGRMIQIDVAGNFAYSASAG
jgi:hypothetical protein